VHLEQVYEVYEKATLYAQNSTHAVLAISLVGRRRVRASRLWGRCIAVLLFVIAGEWGQEGLTYLAGSTNARATLAKASWSCW